MPKISVIMCAYNSESTIKRAIDCLVNQTLKDIEIILVNDGSTDNTLSIMKKYSENDTRIKIISHENMGHGLARNTGLEVAQGDYLAFMDSDDTLSYEAFEKMYEQTQKGKYDIVVCNHNRIYTDRIRRNVREVPNKIIDLNRYGRKKYIERYLISYRHEMGVFNKLIKHSLFTKHNIIFPSNKEMLYDDVLPILQLSCVADTIVSYNHAFYNYYINRGSISDMQNTASRMPYTFPVLVEAFRNFLQQNKFMNEIGEILPVYYYSQVFFGLIRAKHFGHANISGSAKILATHKNYYDYMQELAQIKIRSRFITKVAPGLNPIKSLPTIGLCWLTLIQGKLITKNALTKNYEKVDKLI